MAKPNDPTKRRPSGRKPGLRAVAATLPTVTRRLYRRRGFAQAEILTKWPDIVGPQLADYSAPERLIWPRDPNRPDGGTLRIRVVSAWAPQVTHLQPLVIDRVNRYFGYPAIAKLAIVHGQVTPREVTKKPAQRPLKANEEARLDQLVSGFDNPDLQQSLRRLGATLFAAAEPDDKGPPSAAGRRRDRS